MFWGCLRRLFFLVPAETAHLCAIVVLRLVGAFGPLRRFVAARARPRARGLETRALGLTFPSPVVLAAGFDKDAEVIDGLSALGFGAIEIGTVTVEPQPGNPRPRLFRLPMDRALVNRMGFNNLGAAAAAARLARRRDRQTIVGVNIGKTKVVAESEAAADYVRATELLAPHADYLVVNVSSPNTPGLRDLQSVERLEPLLRSVRASADRVCASRRVPLLVKIAPDLNDADIDAVGDLALALGLDGIIATNTTIARDGLRSPAPRVEACGAGGLSGAPLRARALEVLRRLRARVGDRVALVASGGIESVDDAWERIRAGASFVQIYTGLIYFGPGLPRRMAEGLAERARAAGFERVQDAVGTG